MDFDRMRADLRKETEVALWGKSIEHHVRADYDDLNLAMLKELHDGVQQANRRLDRREEVDERQRQGTAVVETIQLVLLTLTLGFTVAIFALA